MQVRKPRNVTVKPYEPNTIHLEWHRRWAFDFNSLTDIALAAGVSVQAVHQAVNKVAVWDRAQKYEENCEYRERHTRTLESIAKKALKAWEQSSSNGTEPGDAKYLDECRAALADIRKIWGSDKPPEVKEESEFRWSGGLLEKTKRQYAVERIEFLQGMLESAPGN